MLHYGLMSREEFLKKITDIIKNELGPSYKVFLFGSWAKGTAVETSDLDIGILGSREVPPDKMANIKALIEAVPTLRRVYVVDLIAAGEEFRNSVLAHAKEL